MLRNITNFKNSENYRKSIHQLIPGGSHTYSKGDDQFPAQSPAAIKYGLGAHVWDIDDNQYLDCSMGLTSVSLGHAYAPVIDAVKNELNFGVNFQRPSHLEEITAKTFLELLPGHEMIKFAKNGSTVTTAAVKLARAFTGREMVAFPSDHPFYSYDDWFIGKTACDKGVPNAISQLSCCYTSTNLETLSELFRKYPNKIACIITEPEKSTVIDPNYVKNVSDLCKKNGALFIMDEMITGFKVDFPGAFSKYGIVPDMATWGKGIANGFSFCALTGKREIMNLGGILQEGSEKVFLISSTHGGETHALVAAMATISEFKKNNVLKHCHEMGELLIQGVEGIIRSQNLEKNIAVSKCAWMPTFFFKNANGEVCSGFRTLFMQEMIKRGVLFQGIFAPCFSHKKSDIDYFSHAFLESCKIYSMALEKGFNKFLIGPAAKPVFRKFL